MSVCEKTGGVDTPLLLLVVESIGMEMLMRTFDMRVDAHIGIVELKHLKFKGRKRFPCL